MPTLNAFIYRSQTRQLRPSLFERLYVEAGRAAMVPLWAAQRSFAFRSARYSMPLRLSHDAGGLRNGCNSDVIAPQPLTCGALSVTMVLGERPFGAQLRLMREQPVRQQKNGVLPPLSGYRCVPLRLTVDQGSMRSRA